jgi:predicted GIY-YIG superfamily endonuclease
MGTRSDRDTYKYVYKIGNVVKYFGMTSDLERREKQLKRALPTGHLKKVGRRATRDGALRWKRENLNR